MRELALTLPQFGKVKAPGDIPTGGINPIDNLLRTGVTILIISAIVLSLAFIVIGGIQWIVSGGDKAGVESARNKIVYSVIGLIIVFFSYFVIRVIGYMFGVNLIAG